MELLLIRHALPERIETVDGTPADPPLSAIGRSQAQRVARWLAAEKIGAIYVSPMRRARETADALARAIDVKIEIDPGLVEMDHLSDVYVPLEQLKAEDYPRWQEMVQRGGLYAGVDLDRFRRTVVESVERAIAANPGGPRRARMSRRRDQRVGRSRARDQGPVLPRRRLHEHQPLPRRLDRRAQRAQPERDRASAGGVAQPPLPVIATLIAPVVPCIAIV
jgi:hypothetical protein